MTTQADIFNAVMRQRVHELCTRLRGYAEQGAVTVNIQQVLHALDVTRKGQPIDFKVNDAHDTVAAHIRNAMPADHVNLEANRRANAEAAIRNATIRL